MYEFNIGDVVVINGEMEGTIIDMTVGLDAGWYNCELHKFYPDTVCQSKRTTWVPFNFLRLKEN